MFAPATKQANIENSKDEYIFIFLAFKDKNRFFDFNMNYITCRLFLTKGC